MKQLIANQVRVLHFFPQLNDKRVLVGRGFFAVLVLVAHSLEGEEYRPSTYGLPGLPETWDL
jgi:hypothetical protein